MSITISGTNSDPHHEEYGESVFVGLDESYRVSFNSKSHILVSGPITISQSQVNSLEVNNLNKLILDDSYVAELVNDFGSEQFLKHIPRESLIRWLKDK